MAPSKEVSYDGYTTLAVSLKGHVLHVALDRVKKLNAWSPEMWVEFKQVFIKAGSDPRVRAIVLSANGRIFTAGLDLEGSVLDIIKNSQTDPARTAFMMRRAIAELQTSYDAVEQCDKPVICVMHGAVIGAGVDLAAACDIRYASADAYFCIKEVDIALAADVGTLARFPRVIGNDSVFRELAYTARNFSANEAKEIGFLGRILPTKDAALAAAFETAELIAEKSPVGVQGTKNVLLFSRDHSVAEGNAYVASWNASALQTNDLAIAMQASLKKKKAVYPNL